MIFLRSILFVSNKITSEQLTLVQFLIKKINFQIYSSQGGALGYQITVNVMVICFLIFIWEKELF